MICTLCTREGHFAKDCPQRPTRLQRQRSKGWKKPEGAIYVGRPMIYGNPFPVDVYGRAGATELFRRFLTGDMSTLEMSQLSRCDPYDALSIVTLRRLILDAIPALRGKTLLCWCSKADPCHADVLLELANSCSAIAQQTTLQTSMQTTSKEVTR